MFLPFFVQVKSIGATRLQADGFIAQFTISFASVRCIFETHSKYFGLQKQVSWNVDLEWGFHII